MDLKLICFKTHIHIIKGCAGIITNKAATFQCSDGTPQSCRARPASPWNPVRAVGQMATSIAIALYFIHACVQMRTYMFMVHL